ncbi:hypothetical protein [Vogesella indigofera]|uniref:hypothetical protein n=1 Tax=Vogesella indigofera TaxID=45465 RepID=UPI00234F106F|nr:hypothetical protein [Vogesella indigofera]MDC7707709.1 hypothetical protein [Vogesella indigofera]
MKKIILQLLSIAAMSTGFAHAGGLNFVKEKENQFKYFDANDTITDLYIHQKASGPDGRNYVFLLRVPRESGSEVLSSICVNSFEIDRIEKGFFSSKKTVYYNHQVVNASKIKTIRPLTTEENIKLGFDADENEDIGRVELSDGAAFYALTPAQSSYSICGRVRGENQVINKSALAVEYYRGPKDFCFKQEELIYPRLQLARDDVSYFYGNDARPMFDACKMRHAKEIKENEARAAKEAQALKEANEKFELEKKKHKMIPGVQILGELGAVVAKDLIHNCYRGDFLDFYKKTKDEWRKTECLGYYMEEIDGLRREMRIRGLIQN